MASFYEIPLLPVPQRFTIALGGKEYRLTVQYRDCLLYTSPSPRD